MFQRKANGEFYMNAKKISDEDRVLFREAVARIPKHTPQEKVRLPDILDDVYPEDIRGDTVLAYRTVHVSPERWKRLRLGRIAYEAALDLHECTVATAKNRFMDFMQSSHVKKYRCLLVIHGKGGVHGQGSSVLKKVIDGWLRAIPYVLAFHSAVPADGGTGATYILLK
jgi:DNA-nicking Smr family endonuclease